MYVRKDRIVLALYLSAVLLLATAHPQAQDSRPASGDMPSAAALVKELQQGDSKTRESAAGQLEFLGRDLPPEAVLALVRAFRDESRGVRRAAAITLARKGKDALPYMLEQLKSRDPRARGAAALSLGKLREDARPAVKMLIERLKDPEVDVRCEAISALGWIGDPLAISPLLDTLEHAADETTVQTVLSVLGQYGAKASRAAPHLVKWLINESGKWNEGGERVAFALAQMGEDTFPHLRGVVEDGACNPKVRYWAVFGIGRLAAEGMRRRDAVLFLVGLVQREKGLVADEALFALFCMGPAAESALPPLRRLLEGKEALMRVKLAEVIYSIHRGDDKAMGVLLEGLEKGSRDIRGHAAVALLNLAPVDKRAVQPLIRALADEDPGIRLRAPNVLGRMGALAEEALPALRKAAQGETPAAHNARVAIKLIELQLAKQGNKPRQPSVPSK
jgi:HEAT repeat protein